MDGSIMDVTFQGLGFLPGYDLSDASSMSADGAVVVGTVSIYDPGPTHDSWQAFRWTTSNGMVGLGYLPGFEKFSTAVGVSADGSNSR